MFMQKKVPRLGLRNNWRQFGWLVLMNAFVGSMVGIERSIFPLFAESSFGITGKTAILSFIVAFGFSKAFANFYTGKLANIFGRKKLLVIGWVIVLPVPFILLNASSWNWIIFANILLGISQGFTWSSTVLMKIDLVGERNRGLAMGLNEFAGYLAVGGAALLAGYLTHRYGVIPYPFYVGIGISCIGLLLSIFVIEDTVQFVYQEIKELASPISTLSNVFVETTFKHPTLSSITYAGMINNLNDGMIWGLLPILLLSKNWTQNNIAIIAAVYPAVWGIGQLLTGYWSDYYSKKRMLVIGMLLQGIVILFLPFIQTFWMYFLFAAMLGWGTAMVYPTFLSSIASTTHPTQRADIMGIFRFWRDSGYAFGAIISGILADYFGISIPFIAIGSVTLSAAWMIQIRTKSI